MGWLKKRTALISELAMQLASSKSAHATALGAVQSAQDEFDEVGSDRAAKALTAAREAEQLAGEHVERARRLLPRRVGDLAAAAVARRRAEQGRLQGPVSDEINGRLAKADQKIGEIETQLEAARETRSSIASELGSVNDGVRRLDTEIERFERRKAECLALDLDDPNQLRRFVLGAEIIERDVNGGE